MPMNKMLSFALQPKTEVVPRPILLKNISLLVLTTGELAEFLSSAAAENPFLEYAPPEILSAGNVAGRTGDIIDPVERVPEEKNLFSDLRQQLLTCPALSGFHPTDIESLLLCLDPRGLLNTSLEEMADLLGLDKDAFDSVLAKIQNWVEPAGLFARDLGECLALQLERAGEVTSDAYTLVKETKRNFRNRDWRLVWESLGWSEERLQRALEKLRLLDFSPGETAGSGKAPPVFPEIKFTVEKEEVSVDIIEETVPKVELNRELMPWREQRRLKSVFREAKWLVEAVGKRLQTKKSVAEELVRFQKDFLVGKDEAPAPCVLSDIAGTLGIHESTVQRVASTTWYVSRRGSAPLSGLFSRPLRSRPGLSVAQFHLFLARSLSRGKTAREIALQSGVPPRTVRWHISALKKSTNPGAASPFFAPSHEG
jgi:RNA polymerase sigma-54 factor